MQMWFGRRFGCGPYQLRTTIGKGFGSHPLFNKEYQLTLPFQNVVPLFTRVTSRSSRSLNRDLEARAASDDDDNDDDNDDDDKEVGIPAPGAPAPAIE